jgi:hypothetical protein
VSRAGIIYVSDTDLGYDPIVQAWLRSRREDEGKLISELYNHFVTGGKLLDWLKKETNFVSKRMRQNEDFDAEFVLLCRS